MRVWIGLPIAVASVLALSCGGPQQPAPPPAPPKQTADQPAQVVAAPVAELRGELLGRLSVGSLDSLVALVSGYLVSSVPVAFQPMLQPEALKSELLSKGPLDGLGPALDTARPVLVGFVDPMVYRKRPLAGALIAVPLKDAAAFVDYLDRRAGAVELTPWRDRIYASAGLLARVERDWAFLASHEKLVQGARGALLPLASRAVAGEVRLDLDMVGLKARFGAQADQLAASLGALTNQNPGLVGLQSSLRRWLDYLKSMQELELRLELQPARIRGRFAARAPGQGAFRTFVDGLPVGEPWGARYLPADAAVVFLNRARPDSRQELIDDSLKLLGSTGAVTEASLARLRQALLASSEQFGSESAAALWATPDGGLGMGAVAAVKNAAAAQKQLAALLRLAGTEISQLTRQAVSTDRHPLAGLRVGLNVRGGALRLGGLRGDLYELALTWPRGRDAEERKQIATSKKLMVKLLGPRPTAALVGTGELALLAFGKDYRKRLAAMLAVARGGAPTVMEKRARELAGSRQLSTLVHVPLVAMLESALRIADQVIGVPVGVRDALAKVLPAGKDIPLTASLYREGDALIGDLEVSADLVGALVKTMLYFRGAAAPAPAPVP